MVIHKISIVVLLPLLASELSRGNTPVTSLGYVPTTAGSPQFCFLCCQPEPFPESLPARPSSLTRRCPCSLPVWSGQSIHMGHRTYSSPRHSISHTPTWGTERCDPPQMTNQCCAIARTNFATTPAHAQDHVHHDNCLLAGLSDKRIAFRARHPRRVCIEAKNKPHTRPCLTTFRWQPCGLIILTGKRPA